MKKFIRSFSMILAITMIVNTIHIMVGTTVSAAEETATVTVGNLGNKGTVTIGSKTKSGTWYKMSVGNKKAFCMDLGKACHNGNTYTLTEEKNWNQDTGGNYYGYYAKIIRWYVVDKGRTEKAYTFSQALIWSVVEGKNSEENLKNVIEQVKNNTGYYPNKTVNELYKDIFEPSGNWTAKASIYSKSGGSSSYQRLLVVDADEINVPDCKFLSRSKYYRQRITLIKKDNNGNPLSGIQFTLKAHNLDDLYGFFINDLNGLEYPDDISDTTEFVSTGLTNLEGRIIWRLSYWISTKEYAYYGDTKLSNMTDDEKKAAKKYLTQTLDLDEGVDFGKNMTKAEAEALAEKDLNNLRQAISNTYTLVEDNTGTNKNVVMDRLYSLGLDITLTQKDSWERDAEGKWPDLHVPVPAEYPLAKQVTVVNHAKKVSLKIKKSDSYSTDKKAHGDATLDGAMYGVYTDSACTQNAKFYNSDGSSFATNLFETKNGEINTPYLACGKTYYIREVKPPKGYKLNPTVYPITLDGSKYPDIEYVPTAETVNVDEQPILSKIEIEKTWEDPDNPGKFPEEGATFQVYLAKKLSYDACTEYERDILVMDENGYACSKNLYYGRYMIHQVNTGGIDSIMIDDQPIELTEEGAKYSFSWNDELFKAYLKIVKKDDNTGKSVLKPNTKFKIYQVTDAGDEVLVEQNYVDGTETKTISEFVTDDKGEVTTVESLVPGNYKIYEVDSASGLHITTDFIPFEVNSKADNYTYFTDDAGEEHALITVDYANRETYGKLKIFKLGETLTGFENGNFVYSKQPLNGVKFEIYADGDISTQDNQGTTWYKDGELVATITSGQGVEFTKECKDITGQSVDAEGVVTVNLPLGKYKVKEKKTVYGFLPVNQEWSVEFNWENMNNEYVLNATDATDENGLLSVLNDRAKAEVNVLKTDANSKQGLAGVKFGVFSKNAIYNSNGDKIVGADEKIGEVVTDDSGKAVVNLDLPLKSEKYNVEDKDNKLNSGDYYLKEVSVSGSYYLDDKELPIHLEYADDKTPVIKAEVSHENTQTEVQIDKTSITGAEEIEGCLLQITDENGLVIATWTSGTEEVSLNSAAGYQNLSSELTADKHRVIRGLLHDTTYTLAETRPADGYVTADSITFKLVESNDKKGQTLVAIKAEDGTFTTTDKNVVHMVDEQTTVIFKKQTEDEELLADAKIAVYDEDKNKVAEFTTTSDSPTEFVGTLAVGKTYFFEELEAPDGYLIAAPVSFTVADTADEQVVVMTDKKYGTILVKAANNFFEGLRTYGSPTTGDNNNILLWLGCLFVSASVLGVLGLVNYRKRREGYDEKDK